jgi:endonuclease YncB( thermonuclease family)
MRVSRYALVFACGLAAGYGVHVWQIRLANPDTPARCIRVIDGDTLEVIWKGETNAVRLVGVEAPEIRPPCRNGIFPCLGPLAPSLGLKRTRERHVFAHAEQYAERLFFSSAGTSTVRCPDWRDLFEFIAPTR